MIDEVEQRRVRPVQVLEDQQDGGPVRDPLEEPAPRREELDALERDVRARVEERRQARLDPAPVHFVRHELVERPFQLSSGELGLGALVDPGAAADHLGHRGERDPLAVGGCPADVEGQDIG